MREVTVRWESEKVRKKERKKERKEEEKEEREREKREKREKEKEEREREKKRVRKFRAKIQRDPSPLQILSCSSINKVRGEWG